MDDNLQKLLDEGFTKEQAEKILVATMEITFIHVEKDLLAQGMNKQYVEQAVRKARSREYERLVELLGRGVQ